MAITNKTYNLRQQRDYKIPKIMFTQSNNGICKWDKILEYSYKLDLEYT